MDLRRKKLLTLIAFILAAVMISGCTCLRGSGRDCRDFNLSAVEHVIHDLEASGKIRHDQATARIEDMRSSWNSYHSGHLTCRELLRRAEYHTDGRYDSH